MRKCLGIILGFSIALTGCQAEVKPEAKAEFKPAPIRTTVSKEDREADEIMEDFNRLIAKEPREDEVLDFIQSKISKVAVSSADEMILGYERIQNSTFRNRHQFMMKEDVQAICLTNFKFNEVPEDSSNIEDVGLRIYVEELKNTGYKLVVKDGKYLPELDYSFYEQFVEYLSDEMQTYLKLMGLRKELLFTADQSLPITWDEVFDRIMQFENFLARFPESKKKDVVWLNYEYYTKLYLYGTEGTPAFNHIDNELDNWLNVSYANIYLGNQESQFIVYFKEYLQVMSDEEYILTEVVDEQRNTVLFNLDMQLIY